jgi:two-component system NtrC family sensor kinase
LRCGETFPIYTNLTVYDPRLELRQAMTRRSKAGGKTVKGGRRKAATPRHALPSGAVVSRRSATATLGRETATARLTRERDEALEREKAVAKVLDVMNRSTFDLRAIFEAVAESAVRLCGADRAFIFRFDGELLRLEATHNATPEFAEWVAQHPIRPGRHSAAARAALERRTIHIPDLLADPEYSYGVGETGDEPRRTLLGVPILKGDELLGVVIIYHAEVSPFTDNQIALVETFADQAGIAIENVRLFEEVQARTRELAQSLDDLRTAQDRLVQTEKARLAGPTHRRHRA